MKTRCVSSGLDLNLSKMTFLMVEGDEYRNAVLSVGQLQACRHVFFWRAMYYCVLSHALLRHLECIFNMNCFIA